jgi:hypothetical protein
MPRLFAIRHKLFSGDSLELEEKRRDGSSSSDELLGVRRLFGFTTLRCGVLPKMRDFRKELSLPAWREVLGGIGDEVRI